VRQKKRGGGFGGKESGRGDFREGMGIEGSSGKKFPSKGFPNRPQKDFQKAIGRDRRRGRGEGERVAKGKEAWGGVLRETQS